MGKAEVIRERPQFPWLELDDPDRIALFLSERDWIEPGESVIACETAGEGNMNLTVRVRTTRRSLVLKQARPWVEKYPHIPAPWDRVVYEQRFYERVSAIEPVARRMPALLAFDPDARVLLLEDIVGAVDFTSLYQGDSLKSDTLCELVDFLVALHEGTRGKPDPLFANRQMRQLNHQHIFEIPLAADNALELDDHEPGLCAAAARLRADQQYVRTVLALGQRYLADGSCLVHGDFFPGSWLRAGPSVRVIDPEFCFYGDPEWDVGVLIAHLALADQPLASAHAVLDQANRPCPLDCELVARFAAVEVMRRLIGVAQLPLPPTTGRRGELLERSRAAMIHGYWERLW